MHYIIPARKESKGVPFKNRNLFRHTADIIPKKLYENTIVSTDDEYIAKFANKYNFKVHNRSKLNSSDTASTRDFLVEVIRDMHISGQICMLYLTYPERTWTDVTDAIKFFKEQNAKSLLCREEIETHPYVCMYECENFRGRQIVKHDLCRRQEYPKCFKVCHKIAILHCEEIHRLNSNIYNSETVFFPVRTTLDIDTFSDLNKLNNN